MNVEAHTYSPENIPEIVNREDEINKLKETLYRLTTPGKLLTKPILEFNGIGGIGKSVLLRQFLKACEAKTDLRHVFIDFSDFRQDPLHNLNTIVISIIQKIGIRNNIFDRIVESGSAPENLTEQLIHYLVSIQQTEQKETPIAFIFDSFDEVPALKDWLIRIVDKTIDAGKILFVVASKISLDFSEKSNLEKKVYKFGLTEFDQQSTQRQIQSFKFDRPENWTKAVFRMTQGHPLANRLVLSAAKEMNYLPQHLSSNLDEFLRLIDKDVVEEKVFRGIDEKKTLWYRQILTPLSIPRLFNLSSMESLIEKFAPDFALRSSWHYSNYIRELKTVTSFVHYSLEKSAYTVNPILRSVLSLTLKKDFPEKFTGAHQFLVEMYADWMKSAKGTDKTKFFLEKIYHQLALNIPASSLFPQFHEFAKSIGQRLNEVKRRDARQQFIEEFKADAELGEFFDENDKQEIRDIFN